ncbi:MAG: dTDP-4-dehydrorhamnose 3,5-epimerase [Thermodesulfobacteriota bacterium]
MLQLRRAASRGAVAPSDAPRLAVRTTTLDGVLLIEPPTRFEDFRGEYVETWNRALYAAAGIDVDFVQDDISVSTRDVLRGIHGDDVTWKLVSCLAGRFYLVVVNWDERSPHYRRWEAFTLSERNRLQVLIPPRHGNGHLVLGEQAIFHYKQSSYYDRARQFTLAWDDPELGIWWPARQPIVSQRDLGVGRGAHVGAPS